MTRLLFFPLFFLLFASTAAAQNLIPDPGFEIHNENCAPYPGLTHWFNPNLATPDTWCYPGGLCNPLLTEANINELQLLEPYEGNCMAGIFVAYPQSSNMQTRDYLTTELNEPLIEGEEYELSFWLYRHIVFDAAIDKIGFYFSEDQPYFETFEMLPVEPQIELDTLIVTTDEWVYMSRTHTAQGGERYMTFGNFRDHDEMTYVLTGMSWKLSQNSYYFFDEMQLALLWKNVESQEKFINYTWNGHILSCHVHERNFCRVYDTSGRLIEEKLIAPGSAQINLTSLTSGIYIVRLEGASQKNAFKLWKE